MGQDSGMVTSGEAGAARRSREFPSKAAFLKKHYHKKQHTQLSWTIKGWIRTTGCVKISVKLEYIIDANDLKISIKHGVQFCMDLMQELFHSKTLHSQDCQNKAVAHHDGHYLPKDHLTGTGFYEGTAYSIRVVTIPISEKAAMYHQRQNRPVGMNYKNHQHEKVSIGRLSIRSGTTNDNKVKGLLWSQTEALKRCWGFNYIP
jgi:hypothetical protein